MAIPEALWFPFPAPIRKPGCRRRPVFFLRGGQPQHPRPLPRDQQRDVAGGRRQQPCAVHAVVDAFERDEFAREQRRQPTHAGNLLWERFSGGALRARFRRQHPIGDFVLDFDCAPARLAGDARAPSGTVTGVGDSGRAPRRTGSR